METQMIQLMEIHTAGKIFNFLMFSTENQPLE